MYFNGIRAPRSGLLRNRSLTLLAGPKQGLTQISRFFGGYAVCPLLMERVMLTNAHDYCRRSAYTYDDIVSPINVGSQGIAQLLKGCMPFIHVRTLPIWISIDYSTTSPVLREFRTLMGTGNGPHVFTGYNLENVPRCTILLTK